jgi:hypothetical protein
MTRALDIYIRAHGDVERRAPILDLAALSRFSFFSYCPHGGSLSAEAADGLIFDRICKNLNPERRAKVLALTQPTTVMEYVDEWFSAASESLFPVRKGKVLSTYKQKTLSSPNYEIHWSDFHDITAIIAHDANENVYCWIPKHNMDNVYYDYHDLRSLLSPEYFPRDLLELIEQIQDAGHFLGKVACRYDHVNLHWSLCKYVYSKRKSEWVVNKGTFGHSGRYDSTRLNKILISTVKQQENVAPISRHNSI